MGGRGVAYDMTDFTGGLNTFDPEFATPLAQSPDLDNLILLDRGFKKRQGDVAWNSSAMVSSSTAIQGMGYIQFDSGTQFLNSVAGTKFFTDSGLSGTMTDNTGAITITAGNNNIWTPVSYNNLQIWFGGPPTAYDAPFTYSGSGNAAALAGSPPSAATAFVCNNRVFAMNTVANPSRIFWPILSNPSNWTGAGSGNADVAASDGTALRCGVVIGPDSAILFKDTSTHLMVLTRAPFPVYQLQRGVGIAGQNAWAFANGVIYFVTPGRRMMSTSDGVNFQIYPNDINDIWDSINTNRIANIQGLYYQSLEWIVFCVSTGSSTTNNYLIIWDLRRKAFLRCTTGFKCNVMCLVQNRRWFGGHYDGKMYEKDKAATFTDASIASPGIIDAYWRTPFHGLSSFSFQQYRFTQPFASTVHPAWLDVSFLSETATVAEISYGFDFVFPKTITNQSLITGSTQWDVSTSQWDVSPWGGGVSVIKRIFTTGRGNLFSLKIRNAVASQGFTFQGFSVQLKSDKSRKILSVI
jgi:hypothetical protein